MTGGSASAVDAAGAPERFRTTHWSVVCAARQPDSALAAEALEALCRTYWYPVYAYLRRHGHAPDAAEDLTQEFFRRLVRQGFFASARAERGKFRWFLLGALRHFLANEHDHRTAGKRGGGRLPLPLDTVGGEACYASQPANDLTADRLYEQAWALTVLQKVRAAVRQEYAGRGRSEHFDLLERLLPGGDRDLTQAEVGQRLGLAPGSIKAEVHRLKQRFGETLRREIAHTVDTPESVDGEIHYLIELVSH